MIARVDKLYDFANLDKLRESLGLLGQNNYDYLIYGIWIDNDNIKDAVEVWQNLVKYFSAESGYGDTTEKIRERFK